MHRESGMLRGAGVCSLAVAAARDASRPALGGGTTVVRTVGTGSGWWIQRPVPPVRAAIWMVKLEPSRKVRKPSRSTAYSEQGGALAVLSPYSFPYFEIRSFERVRAPWTNTPTSAARPPTKTPKPWIL